MYTLTRRGNELDHWQITITNIYCVQEDREFALISTFKSRLFYANQPASENSLLKEQPRSTDLHSHWKIRPFSVDLGGNVSWTHLGDGGAVERPLNSKTAPFIWRLIDVAVIFIHSIPCQMEQIFTFLIPSFSPCEHLCSLLWNRRSLSRLV